MVSRRKHISHPTRRTRAARSLSTVSALTPAESPDGADALSTVHTLKSSNASYVANSNMRGKGRAWLVSAHRGEGSRRGSSRVEQALPLCHLCAARTAAHAQHLSSLCRPTRGAAGREHALSAVGAAAHVALVLGRMKGGSETTKLGRGRLMHRCFFATAGPGAGAGVRLRVRLPTPASACTCAVLPAAAATRQLKSTSRTAHTARSTQPGAPATTRARGRWCA